MPAGGDRDGQMRRPRAELRQRRRRDLRGGAGLRGDRGPPRCGPRPSWPPRRSGSARSAAAEGPLFPVDANLRPEGRTGPLVRTVASHRAYYERWAKTWEFQALLKARPVAGDAELGQDYLQARGAVRLAGGPARRTSSRTCRRCGAGSRQPARPIRPTVRSSSGPGGLRDIEFAVQLLQLVHGRTDETLRGPGHPGSAGRAGGRRLRGHGRTRRGWPARYRFLRACRAPAPAPPAAPDARAARGPGRAAPDRPGDATWATSPGSGPIPRPS